MGWVHFVGGRNRTVRFDVYLATVLVVGTAFAWAGCGGDGDASGGPDGGTAMRDGGGQSGPDGSSDEDGSVPADSGLTQDAMPPDDEEMPDAPPEGLTVEQAQADPPTRHSVSVFVPVSGDTAGNSRIAVQYRRCDGQCGPWWHGPDLRRIHLEDDYYGTSGSMREQGINLDANREDGTDVVAPPESSAPSGCSQSELEQQIQDNGSLDERCKRGHYAGMITGLEPGSDYQVRLIASDPDGVGGLVEQTVQLETLPVPRESPMEPDQTFTVANASELDQALSNEELDAGDVIALEAGLYDVQNELQLVDKQGTAENPIVIRPVEGQECAAGQDDPEQCPVLDLNIDQGALEIWNSEYVYLHDFAIRNSKGALLRSGPGDPKHIAVRRMTLISTPASEADPARAKGIALAHSGEDIYIARNTIIGPYPLGTDSGGGATAVTIGGESIDVMHNTFWGYIDGLKVSRFVFKGTDSDGEYYLNAGIDVHHNFVPRGRDDGFEFDFSRRNMAVHHNLVANTAGCLSWQPIFGGPGYAFKNICFATARSAYKIKPERDDPSGVFISNNTTLVDNVEWKGFTGDPRNVEVSNNLFIGDGGADDGGGDCGRFKQVVHLSWTNGKFEMPFVLENNAFANDGFFEIDLKGAESPSGSSFAEFSENFGSGNMTLTTDTGAAESPGRDCDPTDNTYAPMFENYAPAGTDAENPVLHLGQTGIDDGEEIEIDPSADGFGSWFKPAEDSPLVDAAGPVPTINCTQKVSEDTCTAGDGTAPDIGAWNRGEPPPSYGR